MRNLAGRTAMITGGGGGIGFGIASACARAGMKVALADVDRRRLDESIAALGNEGAEVIGVTLDVADYPAWHRAVDEIEAALGPVALLCNNAGVGGNSRLAEDDPVRWRMVIEVNLLGAFYGCRTVLPRMLARGEEAHVVNTASLSGLRSNAGMSSYDASKHGLVGMSDTLRAELKGTCVGVSVVYPGTVRTGFAENSAAVIASRVQCERSRLDAEIAKLLKTGMDPNVVGDIVVKAVQAGHYHIHTHRGWKPILQPHFEEKVQAMPASAGAEDVSTTLASLNAQISPGLK